MRYVFPFLFYGIPALVLLWLMFGIDRHVRNWPRRLALARRYGSVTNQRQKRAFRNAVLGPTMWPRVYTIPGGMGEIKRDVTNIAHRKRCLGCGAHNLTTRSTCAWCGDYRMKRIEFAQPRNLRDHISVDGRRYI